MLNVFLTEQTKKKKRGTTELSSKGRDERRVLFERMRNRSDLNR
jgi:hypothetical protein